MMWTIRCKGVQINRGHAFQDVKAIDIECCHSLRKVVYRSSMSHEMKHIKVKDSLFETTFTRSQNN
jgi:hypothetical protein